MTILYLARHGETVWHADNRYAGSTDVALTERGHRQADELGAWANRSGVGAIYTSTLSRAILTATPASEATGLPILQDARFVEVDFGRGEGMTSAEMATAFPDARSAYLANPATIPLPGGESGEHALARARSAVDEVCSVHPEQRVLVVMHSTLMRLLLCDLLGIEMDRYRSAFPQVVNCALTSFQITRGRPAALLGYNVPPNA